jgi:hypothetical protein
MGKRSRSWRIGIWERMNQICSGTKDAYSRLPISAEDRVGSGGVGEVSVRVGQGRGAVIWPSASRSSCGLMRRTAFSIPTMLESLEIRFRNSSRIRTQPYSSRSLADLACIPREWLAAIRLSSTRRRYSLRFSRWNAQSNWRGFRSDRYW